MTKEEGLEYQCYICPKCGDDHSSDECNPKDLAYAVLLTHVANLERRCKLNLSPGAQVSNWYAYEALDAGNNFNIDKEKNG